MNSFMKKYTVFLLLIVFQVVNIFGNTYIFAGVENTSIQTENIDSWIVPDKVLVKYKDENQQGTNVNAMAVSDGVYAETMPFVQEVVPQDTTVWEYIENLEALSNVDKVEPVFRMRAIGTPSKQIKSVSNAASVLPNDPLLYDEDKDVHQWGLFPTEILDIWKYVSQEKREDIIVAVLDTGVDLEHEDLKDSMMDGWDFIQDDDTPQDENGHGTHVAGIIGAVANNGLGISGAASGVKIMPVKVLDKDGLGDNDDIIAGIRWAVDQGANVINLSLGRPRFLSENGKTIDSRSEAEEEAIAYARSKGVIIIAATGNESDHYGQSGHPYKRDVHYPAAYEGVMAVGAVEPYIDIEDQQMYYQIAGFSNVGNEVDVVAPGVGILSTFLLNKDATSPLFDEKYKYDDGTSMATPFVAALAALLKAADPQLLPDDITNIIKESAVDLGEPGFDQYYGAGLINAKNAFEFPRIKMNMKNTDIEEHVYITDHGIDFDVVGYQADGSSVTVTSAVYGEASIYASTINAQTLQFINAPSIKVQSVDMGLGRASNSFALDKIGGYFIWADDGDHQPYIQSRGYYVVRIPRAPVADAASGTYSLPKTVTLSSAEGGKIYYTLDGSTPSKNSTEYVGAITITNTMKIRAIVIGIGFGGEDISSKETVLEYTKQPSSENQTPIIPIDSGGGSPGSGGGGGGGGGAPGGGIPENEVSGNTGAIPKIEVDDGNVIQDIYTPSVKINKDDMGATIIRAEVATEKIRQMLKNHSKPAIVIQIPTEPSEGTLQIEMKGELFELAREHNKYLLLQTKGVDIEIRPDMLKNISKDSTIVLKSKNMRSTQWEQINKTKIMNAKIVSDIYDFELLVDKKSVKAFDIPMVLSFKLNLSSITNSSRVGIYYLNEQKSVWEYIGGKVKAANTITGSVEHFSKYTVMEYTRSFTDMSTHWAKEDVEILAAQHIVQGQNDLFYPNRNITRAEVAALISRSLKLKTKDIESPFKDVSSTDWYYEDINKVWQAGIVQGNSKDTFSPNEKISREEIAVMLTRAYAYSTKKDLKQISISAVVRYKDQMKASEWAQWNIQLAHGLGLMKGYSDENFQPKSNATRAEVAASIRRLQGKIE